jgi:hypothetical protein
LFVKLCHARQIEFASEEEKREEEKRENKLGLSCAKLRSS